MLSYTVKDYKIEMIGYTGSMPKGWVSKHIADEYPNLSDKEKKEKSQDLINTLQGNNHKNGIKYGYINVIRRIWATHNNQEFVELPKHVVTY